MGSLRDTLAQFRGPGQRIALDDDDAVEVVAEHTSSEDSAHARSENDRARGLHESFCFDDDSSPAGSRSENSKVPALVFTRGSSSRRVARVRALCNARSNSLTRKNKSSLLPGSP